MENHGAGNAPISGETHDNGEARMLRGQPLSTREKNSNLHKAKKAKKAKDILYTKMTASKFHFYFYIWPL